MDDRGAPVRVAGAPLVSRAYRRGLRHGLALYPLLRWLGRDILSDPAVREDVALVVREVLDAWLQSSR